MQMKTLLLGSIAALAMTGALGLSPVYATDVASGGPSLDVSLDANSFVDPLSGGVYTLVNPAGTKKLHGSDYLEMTGVGLDGYNLVAMNATVDNAWLSIGKKLTRDTDMILTSPDVIGVPLGYGITVLPAALDIAMVKNDDMCMTLGDPGGVLATPAGYKLDGTALIGKVFGPDGWTSPTAIPTTGGCAISAPAGDGSLAIG